MSWSVQAFGKSQAVKALLAGQFERVTLVEPEQTIKNEVASIIDRALSCFGEDMVVKVSASGSQTGGEHHGGKKGEFINSLTVQIEPQWGFIE